MIKKNKANKKSLRIGFLLGLIMPVITFSIFYLINIDVYGQFSKFYGVQKSIFLKLGSLSAIPNMLVFFYFTNKNNLYAARGLLFSTFIIGITIFILYYS